MKKKRMILPTEQKEPIVYENLRIDILEKLIDERNIDYKKSRKDADTKKTIIDLLKIDDEGKYIRETTYEKSEGGYVVGIDLNNHKHLVEIGKLVEKKEAHNLCRYTSNMLYYWSKQKLLI
jgi:hypothetical protein